MLKIDSEDSRMFQNDSEDPREIPNILECFIMIQNDSEDSKMFQNVPECSDSVPECPE
jgi:hypothetical protein